MNQSFMQITTQTKCKPEGLEYNELTVTIDISRNEESWCTHNTRTQLSITLATHTSVCRNYF